MIINISPQAVKMVKETLVKRVYGDIDVSFMTLREVEDIIKSQDIEYSADFGFKVQDRTMLTFSKN